MTGGTGAERNRVVIIVMDSVGIGALPDAAKYADEGSNTLVNTARAVGGLSLPHLARLGLGRLAPIPGVPALTDGEVRGAYGIMASRTAGKDTIAGHWELAGLVLDQPIPTFPQGFPPDMVAAFEEAIGRPTIGNEVASGTEIVARLGQRHLDTGYPIIYTSADSVFQVASHEDLVPVETLYEWCRTARRLFGLGEKHVVGRVIARPFAGAPGAFYRTERRHDFSLAPFGSTLLDKLQRAGLPVLAVGKIIDIFAGRGITKHLRTTGNMEGVNRTIEAIRGNVGETGLKGGLIFTNLVDFDMLYGHRNDPAGYARALEEFDARMPELLEALRPGDYLMITADHGCDPTTPSTDHSREYVPLLVAENSLKGGVALGRRATFADVSATVAEILGVEGTGAGVSFLPLLSRAGGKSRRGE